MEQGSLFDFLDQGPEKKRPKPPQKAVQKSQPGTLFDEKAKAKSHPQEAVSYRFDQVLGQKKVKDLLARVLARDRVDKAYLFYGPEGVGKDAMAIELAKALNCTASVRPCQTCSSCRQISRLQHPDVVFIFAAPKDLKEKKEEDYIQHLRRKSEQPYLNSAFTSTASILIDQIRELKHVASLTHHQARYLVFILSQADRMTQEAANSLLKLLEEPPARSVFILTSSRLDRLLPTITSRCQLVQFVPLDQEEIRQYLEKQGVAASRSRVISRLAMGSLGKALEIAEEDFETLRDRALEILHMARKASLIEQIAAVSEWTQGRERGYFKELFHMILLWLRDANVFSQANGNGVAESLLYNADSIEKVRDLCTLFDGVNLEKTITEVENCIELIDKNVYINLVFINFFNKLSK
jgi:DNA polymerase-3 subunit delta'